MTAYGLFRADADAPGPAVHLAFGKIGFLFGANEQPEATQLGVTVDNLTRCGVLDRRNGALDKSIPTLGIETLIG